MRKKVVTLAMHGALAEGLERVSLLTRQQCDVANDL